MSSFTKYIKPLFCIASNLLPSAILNHSHKILLPTYHLVNDNTPLHVKHLYKPRTKREFINDLDYILKYYHPINLPDLITNIYEKEPLQKNYFHLSFDDGFRECLDIIAPILKEKGIPATFFINPSFIDNKDLMHRNKISIILHDIKTNNKKKEKITTYLEKNFEIRTDAESFLKGIKFPQRNTIEKIANHLEIDFKEYLRYHKPYLSQDQLKILASEGFSIGAHSMNHPEYFNIDFEEQIQQTKESIEFVKNLFHLPYKTFAFPFTDIEVSKKFFDEVLNGERPIADVTFGVAGIKKDYHPFHLQRIPFEKEFSARSIIKGEYLYYYLKKPLGKNKIIRK